MNRPRQTDAPAPPPAGEGLAVYRARRNFTRTPEPPADVPAAAPPAGAARFFVQRHAARALHYDFRLEWDGRLEPPGTPRTGPVLKSWAVPKGPSLDPACKRLAVQVEDHPVAYGDFEGTIPAGSYGAGEVVLWDRGTWQPLGQPAAVAADWARGRLHLRLQGHKLRGEFLLFRMARDPRHWILRKLDDAYARPGDADGVLHAWPGSVRDAAAPLPAAPATRARAPAAGDAAPGRRAALPEFIAPQLATLVTAAPAGPGWGYEVKLDGYRLLARIDAGRVQLFTRHGHDWSERLAPLVAALRAPGWHSVWLDGEIAVADAQGRTRFQHLQQALRRPELPGVVYWVFDLLYWHGRDLREVPLQQRIQCLGQVLQGHTGARLQGSQMLSAEGADAWQAACRLQLEGLIGKRLDAAYASGRSAQWIKLKCRPGQEVVVGGYTAPRGRRSSLGALLVGVRGGDGGLDYAGRVGTGFDAELLADLMQRLQPLRTGDCPFRRLPPRTGADRVQWVRPLLVVQVRFAGWTGDGRLRQASFEGLREDKEARHVMREDAPSAATAVAAGAAGGAAPVAVTHPDRIVFPVPGITKLEVVRYYEAVAPAMWPHVQRRLLSLLRCPDGTQGACFFQKHSRAAPPAGVRQVPVVEVDGDTADYLVLRNAGGLAALAQWGHVEFHTWGSTLPHHDRPDRVVLDLDPDPGLPWARVTEAAQLAAALMRELGLVPFLKTTGGKGLHVVVPLKPTRGWEEVKAFAKAAAQHLAALAPDRFTARLSKAERRGRIFIDYLRNAAGNTAVAAFSLRARPGAPVAMPLDWSELDPRRDLRADVFHLRNALQRLPQARQAWAGYARSARVLTDRRLEKLG